MNTSCLHEREGSPEPGSVVPEFQQIQVWNQGWNHSMGETVSLDDYLFRKS